MTQVCKICCDSNKLSIDRQIVQGANLAKLAKDYNVPYGSLYNHAQEHLSRQLTQAYQKRDALENLNLLGEIEDVLSKAKQIFDRNFAKGKDLVALKALGETRNSLELLAKIASFLHQSRAMELQAQETAEEFPPATSKDLAIFSDEELKLMSSMGMKLLKDSSLIIEGNKGRRSGPPYMELPTYDEPEPEPITYEEPEEVEEAPAPEPEIEEEPEPPRRRMRRTKFPPEPESELKVRPIEPKRLEPYSSRPLSAAALDTLARAKAREDSTSE